MRYFKTLCFCLVLVLFFSMCKKGEDDPLISFRTRKARVAGEWHLTEGSVRVEKIKPGISNEVLTYEITDDSFVSTNSATSETFKGSFKMTLSFTKKGEVKFSEAFETDIYQGKGTWDFEGSVGEQKKKESVSFNLSGLVGGSSYIDVFNKSRMFFTYRLKELRNKKIVMYCDNELIAISGKEIDYYVTSSYTFEQ